MKETFQKVNQPVRKKDAMNLLLGKPAYVDDVTPQNCLVVKVLRFASCTCNNRRY